MCACATRWERRGLRDGISVGPLLPEGKLMGVLSQLELCRRVSSMLTWPLTDPACVSTAGHQPWGTRQACQPDCVGRDSAGLLS